MKFLKKSLREKKRYIELELTANVDIKSFENEFEKKFKELVGEKGFGEANPLLIRNLWKKNKGVLRVNHKHVTSAKVTLTTVREINNKQIIVKTGKVYGTLKKIKKQE